LEVRDFILTAPSHGAPEKFLGAVCERLVAEGVPIWRGASAVHSLSPENVGAHLIWARGEGSKILRRDHELKSTQTWIGTPVQAVIEGEHAKLHCPLDDEATLQRFPVLRELAAAGGRDYVIYRLDYSEGLAAFDDVYWRRQWLSFTSQQRFSPEHHALFESLLPAFSCRLTLEGSKDAARSLLRAYLGPHASQRVLSGAFRRGTGESLRAVIVFSDMRDFTRFSDSRPPAEVVAALDRYFDALASPMEELGGEVLKFIGDAMLAVFPLEKDACARALGAVKRARQNLSALPFQHGIALHAGEVLYGNIGARGRLDFTVIGGPVNEVCRVEALCKPLQREVLMTRAFVEAAGLKDAVSLGAQALKGVGAPVEVFALP
jgi:adenylate cyclase